MTFKKRLLYFFHVIYVFEKIALKMKLLRLYHNDFLANHFKFKKNILKKKKVLLIQNDKRYKKICKKLRYVSTYENIISLFLRQVFVVIYINAIVNENFNKFYNRIFFKLLWRRHLWCDFNNNRSLFKDDALHIC